MLRTHPPLCTPMHSHHNVPCPALFKRTTNSQQPTVNHALLSLTHSLFLSPSLPAFVHSLSFLLTPHPNTLTLNPGTVYINLLTSKTIPKSLKEIYRTFLPCVIGCKLTGPSWYKHLPQLDKAQTTKENLLFKITNQRILLLKADLLKGNLFKGLFGGRGPQIGVRDTRC